MDEIGTVKLPIYRAVIEGTKTTYNVVVGTAVSLFYFVAGAIKGDVGLSSIAGPSGIAGIAGNAAKFGFVYFLSFIAFLSVQPWPLSIFCRFRLWTAEDCYFCL